MSGQHQAFIVLAAAQNGSQTSQCFTRTRLIVMKHARWNFSSLFNVAWLKWHHVTIRIIHNYCDSASFCLNLRNEYLNQESDESEKKSGKSKLLWKSWNFIKNQSELSKRLSNNFVEESNKLKLELVVCLKQSPDDLNTLIITRWLNQNILIRFLVIERTQSAISHFQILREERASDLAD